MFINKHFTNFRVNNLKTLGIKNAKFPGYYIHMNTNINRDFQICISVPLNEENDYALIKLRIQTVIVAI